MLIFFWSQGGTTEPQTPTGGWYKYAYRQQTKDEIRRERERLGIVPKQAKKIERVAENIAENISATTPNEIVAQIIATQEFNALLADLAKRDAERRAMIAEFAAKLMLIRILEEREAEEAAIVTLILEM